MENWLIFGTWALVAVTALLVGATWYMARSNVRELQRAGNVQRLAILLALAGERAVQNETIAYQEWLQKRIKTYLDDEWRKDFPSELPPEGATPTFHAF
jgi:hypothetical protein